MFNNKYHDNCSFNNPIPFTFIREEYFFTLLNRNNHQNFLPLQFTTRYRSLFIT